MAADLTLRQRHLLTHALAMGGWLSAPLGFHRPQAMAGLLATDPPLFEFVQDPTSAPHERYHLTPRGVDVASQLDRTSE